MTKMDKRDKTYKRTVEGKRESDGERDRISAAPIAKVKEDSNGWKRSKGKVGGG